MSTQLFQSDKVTIEKKMTFPIPTRLVLSDESIYLFDLGNNTWMTIIGHQFGILGLVISEYWNKRNVSKALASFQGKSEDEILTLSPKHIRIPYSQVSTFKVVEGGLKNLGNKYVNLEADSKTYRIHAPKGEFDTIVNILRQQIGAKEQS
jgi:hypothetical protein